MAILDTRFLNLGLEPAISVLRSINTLRIVRVVSLIVCIVCDGGVTVTMF